MAAAPEPPFLLTPGPISTSAETKRAMLRDWGSREPDFIALTARVRTRLLDIANAAASHVAVPVQGSGTFAVEATLGTLVPRAGKALVLVNGAYGRRMVRIVERMGRSVAALESAEDEPNDPDALDRALAADTAVTHVAAVHCETTSGILNPIEDLARVVAGHGRVLILDSISAFGALPLDAQAVSFDAAVVSPNKCLEGTPGVAFALVRRGALEGAAGNAHSFSLDLHDQWAAMERKGEWRFTPPTHVLAALDRALEEHGKEGGVAARGDRYRRNREILVRGMRALGFETLLPDALQSPIIVTFHSPADPRFDFEAFKTRLRERGFVIYPGKLTAAESFRIGCIGRIGPAEMEAAVAAVRASIEAMGVTACAGPGAVLAGPAAG